MCNSYSTKIINKKLWKTQILTPINKNSFKSKEKTEEKILITKPPTFFLFHFVIFPFLSLTSYLSPFIFFLLFLPSHLSSIILCFSSPYHSLPLSFFLPSFISPLPSFFLSFPSLLSNFLFVILYLIFFFSFLPFY